MSNVFDDRNNLPEAEDFDLPSSGIEDIDRAVFDLFDKTLPLQVKIDDQSTKVPVVFSTGERFALTRRNSPIRDRNNALIHADFQVVKDNEEFKISVPINILNASTADGVKMGGLLAQQIYKLNIKTTLSNLPKKIDIDVENLGNSESIIVRDLPKNCLLYTSPSPRD